MHAELARAFFLNSWIRRCISDSSEQVPEYKRENPTPIPPHFHSNIAPVAFMLRLLLISFILVFFKMYLSCIKTRAVALRNIIALSFSHPRCALPLAPLLSLPLSSSSLNSYSLFSQNLADCTGTSLFQRRRRNRARIWTTCPNRHDRPILGLYLTLCIRFYPGQ
jgi:hypothetical protein